MLEPESETRWLRVEDAAKYATVSVYFLKGLVRKREIIPIQAGKHFIIDRHDVDAYLEKLKETQKRDANRKLQDKGPGERFQGLR